MDARLGLEPGWIERACGVSHRRVAMCESQIDLAVAAAREAIGDAGIEASEIDLVLSGSAVPYQSLPTTAPLVMRALGIADGKAQALDINATCLGFLAAIEVAAARITLGLSRVALVFSAEIASRALPWKDAPEVAGLFGDGAGAAILTAAAQGQGAIRAQAMETYPSGYDTSTLVSGGTRIDYHTDPQAFAEHAFFRMNGPALFRLTHRHFPGFVSRLLARAGWSVADVDLVVPHQASPLALDHMIAATGLAPDRVVHVARSLGNQIAASIPVALDIARREGRVPPGTRLLMLGTSAGVSFGGMAIEV
jgi:3-oxoacyl-[acyl-carrier-protein] synthase-3